MIHISKPHDEQAQQYPWMLYLTALSILATLSVSNKSQAQDFSQPPRLVVNITIDQLRSDHLEAFGPLYNTLGFNKLSAEGRVFQNVSYPFAPIDRAAAIATIHTGTIPYYHGIVGEQWLNRTTLQRIGCVDDNSFEGILTQDHTSPVNLTVSTIGDELKISTEGKGIVYSIAPYKDAAILAAGHAANGAYWIDDKNGRWCTSSYYQKNAPAWLNAFNTLASPAVKLADTKVSYRQFKQSKDVNQYVTDIAIQCIKSNGMGLDAVPDLLNVMFFAGDSSRVAYQTLDEEMARFVTAIEQSIGRDRVLFTLTSTGYSNENELPDMERYRIPTGTFYINRTANLLNMYFGALYGTGKYIDGYFKNQIYLNHKLFEQKQIALSDALSRAQEFLIQVSGIRDVYTIQRMMSATTPHANLIRNSYSQSCSGDIIIEVAPGWQLVNEDTHESQLCKAGVVQFPVILYGAGIRPEKLFSSITTDRLAPTIAKAIRIRAPNACSSEPLF